MVALFSRYFGWSIEYILSLSPDQISIIQEGLSEILKAENGVVDKEKEFKRKCKLSELQMEAMIQNVKRDKDGKFNLGLEDLNALQG